MTPSNEAVVQAMVTAYLDQGQATAEALLADDFAFTSLQVDHIGIRHLLPRREVRSCCQTGLETATTDLS
ncbi:MAG: hypothetical protein WCG47_10630, partial [Dermatophilaceae bacterium]